jgi:polyisoprenyl-teichoic acid--peptidoglycan teichoic acid transferase
VRFPAYEAKNPAVDSYLYVKDSDLRKTFEEFMTGTGSSNPRRLDDTTKPDATPTAEPARKKKNKPSSVPGLEQARVEGENMAILAESQGKLGFPFYFPGLRKTGSRYADSKPRIYSIRDATGKLHRAYRLVLNAGAFSEYYGVQGMSWKDPPILDDPDRTRTVDGRKLALYYDGQHLRLVAWKTGKAVYWVTNTLNLSIPNNRLIAIAASLRRLNS